MKRHPVKTPTAIASMINRNTVMIPILGRIAIVTVSAWDSPVELEFIDNQGPARLILLHKNKRGYPSCQTTSADTA